MAHRQSPSLGRGAIRHRRCGQRGFRKRRNGYEIANKQRLGKLPGRIAQDLPNALRQARIPVHVLSLDHMIAAGLLPGPHRDPWDRLIMAQALADDFAVVSIDSVFRDYGVPTCW